MLARGLCAQLCSTGKHAIDAAIAALMSGAPHRGTRARHQTWLTNQATTACGVGVCYF